jgi:serine/threonine protein kinase
MSDTPRLDQQDVEAAFGAAATFLGGGSFGDTWHVNGRAEKILCGEPVADDRLGREVEALGRLSHARVVALHAVRDVTIAGNSYQVMTFDFINGYDAAKAIAAGHIAQPHEARALLIGLLQGAAAMHAARVLHRDIKPANIILRDGDWSDPVLCDLGLARLADNTSITVYPAAVGTARYMAPDQLAGRRAQKGSDLFSVGVVVREALTGQHPFVDPGSPITPASFEAGPRPLPAGVDADIVSVLDELVSVHRHRRGTARSNLRRLGEDI